jgi:transcriptional regulator with PAS, ATPase and Fis domain
LERRIGCFEQAHGGTIFLDEIAEMGSATQAKFLRILEDGAVRRLGSKAEITVDVRVLAATNKDPQKAIKDGTLREDLYYRLNVFTLSLPPLRGRKEDIPLLIQAFIEEFNARYDKQIKSVDDAVLRILLDYPWPGNVRELRNTIERAVVTCEADLITPKQLSLSTGDTPGAQESADHITVSLGTTLEEAEKRLVLKTLDSVNNNKTRAAEILGISLKTLHNKLHRYGA